MYNDAYYDTAVFAPTVEMMDYDLDMENFSFTHALLGAGAPHELEREAGTVGPTPRWAMARQKEPLKKKLPRVSEE